MRFLGVVLVSGMLVGCAMQVREAPTPVAISSRISTTVVVPAYQKLAEVSALQAAAWQRGCDDPAALGAAYHRVADGWAGVFYWNFGPMTLSLRRDRFYHWPERRNAVARALGQLMQSDDGERLEPKHFAKTSIGVQGLPALELLLFGDIDVANDPRACAIGQAIAANLDKMARATVQEWQADILPKMAENGDHPLYFDDAEEAMNRLFTDYLSAFVIIKDQKLFTVMGADIKHARPKKAEAWRSDRSFENIRLNLAALAEMQAVFARFIEPADAKKLRVLFKKAEGELAGVDDLAAAVKDETERKKLRNFTDSLTEIQAHLTQVVAPQLGVTIGFNSLDGD